MSDFIFKGVILVAVLAFVGWRLWSRWQGASDYVENELAEKKIWEEGFQKYKNEAVFQQMYKHIEGKYKTSFDKPLDENTYQIVYATLMDELGQPIHFDDPKAKFLAVFLKGKKDKIRFSMNLQAKNIEELTGFSSGYGSYVPHWAQL